MSTLASVQSPRDFKKSFRRKKKEKPKCQQNQPLTETRLMLQEHHQPAKRRSVTKADKKHPHAKTSTAGERHAAEESVAKKKKSILSWWIHLKESTGEKNLVLPKSRYLPFQDVPQLTWRIRSSRYYGEIRTKSLSMLAPTAFGILCQSVSALKKLLIWFLW